MNYEIVENMECVVIRGVVLLKKYDVKIVLLFFVCVSFD